MVTVNRDALLRTYEAYVENLKKGIADNQPFLNQSNRPVAQSDVVARAEFVNEVARLKAKIANEAGHQDDEDVDEDDDATTPTLSAAKKVIAKAVKDALAELEKQRKEAVAELVSETAKANKLLATNVREAKAELAAETKLAADKVLAAAKAADRKLG